jgi:hypothetical protein
MNKLIVFSLVISTMCTLCSTSTSPYNNYVQTIIDDQTVRGEGCPHGVPYNWGKFPFIRYINMSNERFFLPWGQLYEACDGNKEWNARVEITRMRGYLWSISRNKWEIVVNSTYFGYGAFPENYKGPMKPANVVVLPNGTLRAKAGAQAGTPGYNFHFWSKTQYVMPISMSLNGAKCQAKPSDVGGVYTTVTARLVPDNVSLPTNFTNVRYLMSVGPDFRKTKNQQPPDNTGMGRFKWVTPYWRTFNSINWTPAQIAAYPPPL